MALFLVRVNGIPLTQLVFQGAFDPLGVSALVGTVPNDPNYHGLDVDLLAFGLLASGQVVTTIWRTSRCSSRSGSGEISGLDESARSPENESDQGRTQRTNLRTRGKKDE